MSNSTPSELPDLAESLNILSRYAPLLQLALSAPITKEVELKFTLRDFTFTVKVENNHFEPEEFPERFQ